MLQTNLATRPFYNERAVRLLLLVLVLALLAVTAWTVVRGLALRDEERTLSARATQALADADRLRAEAARLTAQIDPKELAAVTQRAREVNTVIQQRVFSWSTLLGDLEATLPDEVRVTSLQPTVEDGMMRVSMEVEARNARALTAFMDALEARGSFHTVVPRGQSFDEDDTLDAAIEAVYQPRAADRAASPEAADGVVPTRGSGDE